MSELTDCTFIYDMVHALHNVELLDFRQQGLSLRRRFRWYCEKAQLFDITLYERDLQVYYEGLILRDNHGDAFDRNLATERSEQDWRC
jgi:hypothetical protein